MRVTRALTAIGLALLVSMGVACAQATADARFTLLAHSTLLSVDAARLTPDTLTLRLRRTDGQAVAGPVELAVTAQGRNLPVTANTDGTWSVALKDLGGKPAGKLDLVIGHDGIRELLSGTAVAPAAGTATTAVPGLLGSHKQLAWWILNIAIVLIAAIAISRRMS
jgi:hypothetical protein